MKITLISFILMSLTAASVPALAQEEVMIQAGDAPEVLQQGSTTVELGSETTLDDVTSISVINSDENGEPSSYLVERSDGSKVVLGSVKKDRPILGGIVNAYAGAQTLFGVKAGIEIANTVEFGVHARANGLGAGDGAIYPFTTKAGVHLNIKYRPFKNDFFDVFAGIRRERFNKIETSYGYDHTTWKGNTTAFVIGANIFLDDHQSIGFEAGWSGGTLLKHQTAAPAEDATVHYDSPVFNLTYTYMIFKRPHSMDTGN